MATGCPEPSAQPPGAFKFDERLNGRFGGLGFPANKFGGELSGVFAAASLFCGVPLFSSRLAIGSHVGAAGLCQLDRIGKAAGDAKATGRERALTACIRKEAPLLLCRRAAGPLHRTQRLSESEGAVESNFRLMSAATSSAGSLGQKIETRLRAELRKPATTNSRLASGVSNDVGEAVKDEQLPTR